MLDTDFLPDSIEKSVKILACISHTGHCPVRFYFADILLQKTFLFALPQTNTLWSFNSSCLSDSQLFVASLKNCQS